MEHKWSRCWGERFSEGCRKRKVIIFLLSNFKRAKRPFFSVFAAKLRHLSHSPTFLPSSCIVVRLLVYPQKIWWGKCTGTVLVFIVFQVHPQRSTCLGCTLPGSSVHGIFQARILEWTAMPSSRGSSQSTDGTCNSYIPALAGRSSTTSVTWKAQAGLGGEFGNTVHAQKSNRVKRTLGVLPHGTPATEANIDLV